MKGPQDISEQREHTRGPTCLRRRHGVQVLLPIESFHSDSGCTRAKIEVAQVLGIYDSKSTGGALAEGEAEASGAGARKD